MDGDRDAFGILASRNLARLVGVAGLILRDRHAAEDATQEALVRAWRDLPGLRDPDRFDGWLHRILVRSCHDLRRHAASRPTEEMVGDHPGRSPDPAEAIARRESIASGLARLTPDQRTVLVLRFYADLSVEEIAEAIDVPAGTVKSRIHRALDALHAAMAADARRPAQEPAR